VIDEICLRKDVVTNPYHPSRRMSMNKVQFEFRKQSTTHSICRYAFTSPRIHTYNVTVPHDRYARLLPCQATKPGHHFQPVPQISA